MKKPEKVVFAVNVLAFFGVPEYIQRYTGNGVADDRNAAVDCGKREGCFLIDINPRQGGMSVKYLKNLFGIDRDAWVFNGCSANFFLLCSPPFDFSPLYLEVHPAEFGCNYISGK